MGLRREPLRECSVLGACFLIGHTAKQLVSSYGPGLSCKAPCSLQPTPMVFYRTLRQLPFSPQDEVFRDLVQLIKSVRQTRRLEVPARLHTESCGLEFGVSTLVWGSEVQFKFQLLNAGRLPAWGRQPHEMLIASLLKPAEGLVFPIPACLTALSGAQRTFSEISALLQATGSAGGLCCRSCPAPSAGTWQASAERGEKRFRCRRTCRAAMTELQPRSRAGAGSSLSPPAAFVVFGPLSRGPTLPKTASTSTTQTMA